MHRKKVFTILLVVCNLARGTKFASAVEPEGKEVDAICKLADIDNPGAEFRVQLWTDREDATYKVGEEVKLYFKTDKDCYLTLFCVGAGGKVYIIFPNEYHKDNFVKAGNEYSVLPEGAKFVLKAVKPAGVELIKGIATLVRVPLLEKEDIKPAGPVQEVNLPEEQLARSLGITFNPVKRQYWTTIDKLIKIKE